jgi:integrase
MMSVRPRGKSYHVDWVNAPLVRIRGPLGTQNRSVAKQLGDRLEIALAQGPKSPLWRDLSRVIPTETFNRFANHVGVKEKYTDTCEEFRELFESHRNQQVKIGDLANSTVEHCRNTLNEFWCFLHEQRIKMLRDIDYAVIDSFKAWRIDRIRPRRPPFNGKSTLDLDLTRLHHVFNFARDRELIEKNPVVLPATRWDSNRGAQPFRGHELRAMRNAAGNDLFLFLWLKCTGFRRSDAVTVLWQEVDFEQKEIVHVCKKNHKIASPQLSDELLCALDAERRRRNPLANQPVLQTGPLSLNRNAALELFDDELELTDQAFSDSQLRRFERQLYGQVVALGKRAGIHAFPHRFRDSFAIDSLLKGATESLVASMLGDSVATVVKYYLPFVKELRERARVCLNSSGGLEGL